MKDITLGLLIVLMLTSCSVQQFAVNTKVAPFEKGGKILGERVQKGGKNGWKAEYKKDKDLHLLGINIRKSNASAMVKELNAIHYTIETKSNLLIQCITFGMLDYKIVKVIKRDN